MSGDRIGVLFVCLGNICRSPLAEGVFLHKADHRGAAQRFEVDSAGLGGWHVGEAPDPRALAVARRHGVRLVSRARQVARADFLRFDHLICMDHSNRNGLLKIGAPPDKVRLLLEVGSASRGRGHGPRRGSDVPDPYYGGDDGFEEVFGLIDSACEALLDELLAGGR
jgi:protein-tyrosine phosphatase